MRQPIHTVFGGAQIFRADIVEKFRDLSLESLAHHAPDVATFAAAFGFSDATLAGSVYSRVRDKLLREPVEDYRIDFEDGYGVRSNVEEDGHAVAAAAEVVAGIAACSLPWRLGIRVKSLGAHERERAFRTLRLFLATVIGDAGTLPPNFVVTIPKITTVNEVAEFAVALGFLEREFGLSENALKFDVMIETPQIVIGADGRSPLPQLVEAGGPRLIAAVFGGYDFTAGLGITAAHQGLRHPSCDFARNMMLAAFAGTHVRTSDGATAVLPIGTDTAAVHAAWKINYDNVRHSLASGFYQGWDLHPAQLVSRYAATFAFFLEGLDAAGARLKNFVAKSAQATRVGTAFDDAATGRGLVNYFLRAVSTGAITESEAADKSGSTLEEMRGMFA